MAGKLTLVVPRLWPNLMAVGSARSSWQLDGLSDQIHALLTEVEASPSPLVINRDDLRSAARVLEERLLVASEEVHSEAGHHLKALTS